MVHLPVAAVVAVAAEVEAMVTIAKILPKKREKKKKIEIRKRLKKIEKEEKITRNTRTVLV